MKERKILELTDTVDQLTQMLEELDQASFGRKTDKAARLETKDFRIKIEELEETVDALKIEKWQLAQEFDDIKSRHLDEIERLTEHAKQVLCR